MKPWRFDSNGICIIIRDGYSLVSSSNCDYFGTNIKTGWDIFLNKIIEKQKRYIELNNEIFEKLPKQIEGE